MLATPPVSHAPELPGSADAKALKALVPALIDACPDLYDMATTFATRILNDHGITTLKPDQVYWHRFHGSQSNDKTFTGWEHLEHPYDSMTLTQLVITRFTVHDQDNADLLDNDCGFYTAGPDVGVYDQTNEVKLFGSQVMKAFWAFNFLDHFRTSAETFWSQQGDTFRTLAKCTFLAKAIEDREGGRLSDDNFATVIKACASNVSWPVTRTMLDASIQPGAGLQLRRLKVGNYVASDILCIVDQQGRQILYVPGEVWGFHVLDSTEDLHWWVMSQVEQPENRKRFMAHFQVADHDIMEDTASLTTARKWLLAAFPVANLLSTVFHEPHIENVGLNHVLDLLFSAWRYHDHSLLSVQDAWISNDPFTHLRDATHARMLSDAGYMMHSNGELRKKLWIGYLNAFGRMFGPLAAVGWPVALAAVGAGVANVGLNIDQAVNGKTPTERKSGVTGAVFAVIDTLFNAMFLKTGERLPEIAQANDSVAGEERLGAEIADEEEPPLLHSIAPERVAALGEEDSFLESLRAEITENTREGTGERQGIIETQSGKTYIYLRQGLTSAHFQVRYVKEAKGWLIVDPKNPWSFYRNVPVHLNEYKRWETVASPGLKGGKPMFGFKPWGRSPSPLPTVETPATAYDVPEAERPNLQRIANQGGDFKELDERYSGGHDLDDFNALRHRLYDDARAFFADPPLPARPEIPTFAADAPPKVILQRLLGDNPGLVIGENHASDASKRFLIENMPLLAKQKVKTLYLEHVLTDFHQADLDLFNRTGKLSENLEKYLRRLDKGHHTDPTGRYTFLEVVRSAQKNHLRVQAIDCAASYRSKGLLGAELNYRQTMMNFFARGVIEADQAARGVHKWVALVGNSHANTYKGVPGLSELEGTVGLRIEDAQIGEARGIEPDPGRTTLQMGAAPTTVTSDLRLQLETPVEVSAARKLDASMPVPGMYRLAEEQGQTLIVSRARDGWIKCTLLQQDKAGYFFNRSEWTGLNGKHFKTLEKLHEALQARGMIESQAPLTPGASGTTAPTPSQPFSAYDVPAQDLDETHIKLARDADGQLQPISRGQSQINRARQRLLNDAQAFFRAPRTLPPRPQLPTLTPNLDGDTFIEQVLEHAPGLVVGEASGGIGSKQFLIEHMPAFSRAQAKTLFVRGLVTETDQAELDAFHRSGHLSTELRQSLEAADRVAGNDPSGRFNLLQLVRTAQRNNLRVQALDCMASSPLNGDVPNDSYSRRWINNYLTHQQIQRYVPSASTERWVALVDPMSTNTYRELPGISELEGAISLRIEDVPQGEGSSFMVDPGTEAPEEHVANFVLPDQQLTTQLGPVTVGSDIRLQLETPWLHAGQKSLGEQLYADGLYTLSNASGELKLIHRSRTRGLVYTPIQTNAQNKLFIDAPTWPDIHRKPFDTPLDLMDALNANHMTLANWSKPLRVVPAVS